MIRITDEPIATIDDAEELPAGEIGELIVRGPQASPRYVTRTECNADAKIADREPSVLAPISGIAWATSAISTTRAASGTAAASRSGWRPQTAPLFTECVEAIFNTHPAVRRSALVGVGPRGQQTPVLIVEPTRRSHCVVQRRRRARSRADRELRAVDRALACTQSIAHCLLHRRLPVDVRHNCEDQSRAVGRVGRRRNCRS